jgi:hypothetical protein
MSAEAARRVLGVKNQRYGVMPDVTLAGEVKDWLTSVAIVVGGGWANVAFWPCGMASAPGGDS